MWTYIAHFANPVQVIQNKMTTSEVEIAEAIKCGDIRITEAENRLKDVSHADPGREGGEASDKAKALDQIERELKAMRESRKLLVALLANTNNQCGTSITNIRVGGKGEILAGVNHAGGKCAAHVVINNVEATSGGKCIVGVFEGKSFDDFFT